MQLPLLIFLLSLCKKEKKKLTIFSRKWQEAPLLGNKQTNPPKTTYQNCLWFAQLIFHKHKLQAMLA